MVAPDAIVRRARWTEEIASDIVVVLSHQHLDADDASTIAEAISLSTTLKSFFFVDGMIDSAAFPILAASFPHCVSLQRLTFWDTHIGNAGVSALASVLPQCEALVQLDLCYNSFGEDGAFALSLVLPSCRALRSLDLSENDTGNRGTVALAKALQQCLKIDYLSLEHSNVGDEGVVALATALPLCPSLRWLLLSYNHISDVGAKAIMKSVLAHKWLELLSLRGNNLMSLEWNRAYIGLNNAIKRLHTTTCVFPMLSIQLQDSFHVPHGLVRSLLFDMLRVEKLRAIASDEL